ncbi:MAG: AAA family ATPase [Methylomicrobium sp.]
MIKKLTIENFKSHKSTTLDFSNLTVLCGANGVGKSSAIHALLLLRDCYFNKSNFEYMDLKSKSVAVGTAKDALYQYSESNEVGFVLQSNTFGEITYTFETNPHDLTKTVIYKPKNREYNFDKGLLEKESLFNKTCQFISAARLGPQLFYGKNDVVVDVHNQISEIEGRAEHFVHFLSTK